MKSTKNIYLTNLLESIKNKLMQPIYIYEYSPIKRELINISGLINCALQSGNSNIDEIKESIAIFEHGIKLYQERYEYKITILPRSFIKKRAYSLSMFDFTKWKKYWQRNSEDEFLELLQALSLNIINQPYVDEVRELLDSHNNIIYRPNHDPMHSIRQLFYAYSILNYFHENKVERWTNLVGNYTTEELACIYLGIFLFRSGRTNEKGGIEDPTNAIRSANIFAMIATQLEFFPPLVDAIKHNIKEHIPPTASFDHYITNGFIGLDNTKLYKAIFAKRLIDMSHKADLVRCNSWRHYFETEEDYISAKLENPTINNFKFTLLEDLNFLLNDLNLANSLFDHVVYIAKNFCELTGTPVRYEGFPAETKVEDYNLPMKDDTIINVMPFDVKGIKLKDIKSNWLKNIAQCYKTLQQLNMTFNSTNTKNLYNYKLH